MVGSKLKRWLYFWIFVLPALAAYALFFINPFAQGIRISFTNWDGTTPRTPISMAREEFDSKNYWRGPVWINVNWMLSQGMRSYGYREKSDAMKKDMIQLPVRFGFHEYFDSITGQGYGSDGFGWTSALFIDLVYEYYDQDKHTLNWLGRVKSRKLKQVKLLNEDGGPG